jgi:hypothetical protein
MSSDALEITHLEALPTEILQAIVDLLPLWDIKSMSGANKRLRQACLSPLFRCVRFEFSLAGIEALERLSVSDIQRHIITFTYEVPELLKTGTCVHYYAGCILTVLEISNRNTRF